MMGDVDIGGGKDATGWVVRLLDYLFGAAVFVGLLGAVYNVLDAGEPSLG
jgi:hypothetical protein